MRPSSRTFTRRSLIRISLDPHPVFPDFGSGTTGPRRRLIGRFSFGCLLGFVATQGHLIPVANIPGLNWAAWPSLPDLFGYALILSVMVSSRRARPNTLERGMILDLLLMEALFLANFLLVTIPSSQTGAGVRFGAFTILLMAKFIAVYWAAARIPLDEVRIRALHWAGLAAFIWVAGTMLADYFHIIEVDNFAQHLPSATAGKWATANLNSTVGPSHGHTTTAILVLCALIVITGGGRGTWAEEALVLFFSAVATFFSGSRQGIVRILTFISVYLVPKPRRLIPALAVFLPMAVLFLWFVPQKVTENEASLLAMERQGVLVNDPFSNEGLSGRPEIWASVLSTLNEDPLRWVAGYGLGNYVEHRNAAHNMVLQLLQDGGFIFLFLMSLLWVRIFRRVWIIRKDAWAMLALTAGLLSSSLTSGILYPNLATGWYLGLYFVVFHIAIERSRRENS
ncbi:MAG: hypothetical protein H6Q41_624 [Deltaproteobacteria bacterium]|nr:hypothetical protein [Deltaproteobacteria bacterium]